MSTAANDDVPGVVLGLDLGTTATKVVAVDDALQTVMTVERGQALRTGPDGEAVHDPEAVLAGAIDAARECVQACEAGGHQVRGLSFSAPLHTLLALNEAGSPLTPALSLADSRSGEITRCLRAEGGEELHRATGTPVHPMSPLTKLAWFAAHQPELRQQAAVWCGLKDFVLSRFTGRLLMDLSCASATGLLNIHTLAWHQPALKIAQIREHQLPELVQPTSVLPLQPDTAALLGLPAGLPVVAGAGDGPLANLAVGAVRPGIAALSLGTSGAFRVMRDRPGIDEQGRVFCYFLADGVWVLGGAISNAGVVAQWAAQTFGNIAISELLKEAAQIEPGADGLLALPHLIGERAPWWDPDTRGALIGLRQRHGRAAMTRAMVEGVAQQLALVRDSVLAAGARVDTVRATGGALRTPLWEQVLADALDMPLEITADSAGSAGSGYGAALLAWHALGVLPSLSCGAQWVRLERIARPDPVAAQRMAATRHLTDQLYQLLRGFPECAEASKASKAGKASKESKASKASKANEGEP
jgi:gluconokinase